LKTLASLDGVTEDIKRRSKREPLSVGQVFCLGLDAVRDRLGEERWSRSEALVRRLMDTAIEQVLAESDTAMRARDLGYVVVFGDNCRETAEAKVTKIAAIVNEALFGDNDLDGVHVAAVVQIGRASCRERV